MAKIKRIVTSEVEGRNVSDFYGDNSYSFDNNGTINYYGENQMGPVIEPGIVYGANADSGDGYGYNTIKLVPHAPNGDINDDRYLIIDPTTPNHIHIRAGGQQDNSNAELILGAEKAYVKVTDWNHQVQINSYDVANDFNRNWSFENNGSLYGPGGGGSLKVAGIENGDGISNLPITSSGAMTVTANGGDMNFYMDGGMYIGDADSGNQIIKRSDLDNYSSALGQVVSYSATWSGDGLAYNGNPVLASYVKIGKLVQVQIDVEMDNVTNFGTGQYSITLPFPSAYHTDVYGGSIHNTGATTEHYSIKGHLSPSSSAATLWYISGSSQDMAFDHNSPINLTTGDKFHMSFSYICE